MSDLVEIREVTGAERPQVYRLRYDVFIGEFGLRIDADHERQWVYVGERDDRATILGAFVDGQLVGTIRLVWGGSQAFEPRDQEHYGLDVFLSVVEASQIQIAGGALMVKDHRGGMAYAQLIYEFDPDRS